MAITTGGFGVNVMPQVQMADPRLLAFNPALIGQGMEQGMGMARTAQDYQIRAAQQKEWELLAADRQAAERAVLKGKAKLTPAEVEAAIAQAALNKETAAAAMPNVAPAAALQNLNIANQTGEAQLKASLRHVTDATAAAQAKAGLTAAQGAEQTAAQRVELEKQTLDNLYKDAVSSGAMKADEAKLARETLDDKLKNAKDDFARNRAKMEAEIDVLKAQATKLEADAKTEAPFKLYQKMESIANQLAMQEKRVWETPVQLPNGKTGKLVDYWAATRDAETGNAKQEGALWWKSAVPTIKENEEMIQRAMELRRKYAGIVAKSAEIDFSGGESNKAKSESANTPKYEVGKVYPGKDGTKAMYMEDGTWKRIQ